MTPSGAGVLLLLFLLCIGAEENLTPRAGVLRSHSGRTSSNVCCYYCCCCGHQWIMKMRTYIIGRILDAGCMYILAIGYLIDLTGTVLSN